MSLLIKKLTYSETASVVGGDYFTSCDCKYYKSYESQWYYCSLGEQEVASVCARIVGTAIQEYNITNTSVVGTCETTTLPSYMSEECYVCGAGNLKIPLISATVLGLAIYLL